MRSSTEHESRNRAWQPAWLAFWNAVAWLIGMPLVVWIASNHLPEIREFLQRLLELFREFTYAIRDLIDRGDSPR